MIRIPIRVSQGTLALLWVLATACFVPNFEQNALVVIQSLNSLTPDSVQVEFEQISGTSGKVTSKVGLRWSKDPSMTGAFFVETGVSQSEKMHQLTAFDLDPDVVYYFRAYIEDQQGQRTESAVQAFQNNKIIRFGEPILTEFTEQSVFIETQIENVGALEPQVLGYVWSEEQNPTVANKSIQISFTSVPDKMIAELGTLEKGKTYFLKPYAIVDQNVVYGNPAVFTFPSTFVKGGWSSFYSSGDEMLFSVTNFNGALYYFSRATNNATTGFNFTDDSGCLYGTACIQIPSFPRSDYYEDILQGGSIDQYTDQFVFNSEIYLRVGPAFWKFSPTTSQWQELIPDINYEVLFVCAISNQILFFVKNGLGVRVLRYNAGPKTLTSLRTISTNISNPYFGVNAFAVKGDTVFFGTNGRVYEYRRPSNSFTQFDAPCVDPTLAFFYRNNLYMICDRATYLYNIGTGEWDFRPGIPLPRGLDESFANHIISLDDKILVGAHFVRGIYNFERFINDYSPYYVYEEK